MGEHRRKADGRRVFSTDFKRATVQRVVTGEKTVAELLLAVLLDALAETDRRALHRRPHRAKESFDESALPYHGRSSYAALRRGVENVGERIAQRIGNTNDLRQRSLRPWVPFP